VYVAAILGNFVEACRAIQILIGDTDRDAYFSSHLTRREIERHLRIMVDSAKALPAEVREQLPKVDWDDWVGLESSLSCSTLDRQDAVWEALSSWLPITGHYMWQYRQKLPALFRFTPPSEP
jgi:uncharacterized protein with HEPN domain